MDSVVLAASASDLVVGIVPVLLGAAVAGVSAVVKTHYERRDAWRRIRHQFEFATQHTEFLKGWVEVSRTLDADPRQVALVNERARRDLEETYLHAEQAFERGRAELERDRAGEVGRQLRWLLLLEKRKRFASYVAVGVFYVLVMFAWVAVVLPEEKTTGEDTTKRVVSDYSNWWQYLIFAVVSTIVLRVLVGLAIAWIERRTPAGPTPSPVRTPFLAPPEPAPVSVTEASRTAAGQEA